MTLGIHFTQVRPLRTAAKTISREVIPQHLRSLRGQLGGAFTLPHPRTFRFYWLRDAEQQSKRTLHPQRRANDKKVRPASGWWWHVLAHFVQNSSSMNTRLIDLYFYLMYMRAHYHQPRKRSSSEGDEVEAPFVASICDVGTDIDPRCSGEAWIGGRQQTTHSMYVQAYTTYEKERVYFLISERIAAVETKSLTKGGGRRQALRTMSWKLV